MLIIDIFLINLFILIKKVNILTSYKKNFLKQITSLFFYIKQIIYYQK